jgi:hypothetical protein
MGSYCDVSGTALGLVGFGRIARATGAEVRSVRHDGASSSPLRPRSRNRGTVAAGRRTNPWTAPSAASAGRLGATGTPYIAVDGRYVLPVAQDTGTLLGILRQVWDETHPTVLVADNDAAICGPDGCAVTAGHAAHA